MQDTELVARFDNVDSRFEQIDRRFEAIDRRFDSLELLIRQAVSHFDARWTETRSHFETRVSETRSHFDVRITEVRRHMDVIGESLHDDIRLIAEGHGVLHAGLTDVQSRLTRVETGVDRLAVRQLALERRFPENG